MALPCHLVSAIRRLSRNQKRFIHFLLFADSPYRKQISGAVLKLGESGTLSELKRKWWKEMHGGGSCSQTESSSSDTPELDLENVGGVFLVLGIGLLTAILIGVCEFLWNIKAVAIEEKVFIIN